MNIIPRTHPLLLMLLVSTPLAVGCGGRSASAAHDDASVPAGGAGAPASTAGTTGAGGQTATGGGAGGSLAGGASGGSLSTGGVATGGAGTTVAGGTTLTGGTARTGGSTVAGGTTATGGTAITGGTIVVGGTTSPGGTTSRGGTAATGGTTAIGGTTVAGGTTATGGAATTGWTTIHNDFFIYDTTGALLEVRSGCLRQFNGIFYWYGSPYPAIDQVSYASTDLVHWTYKGVAIHLANDANRMDVLYNDTTKQYVMFLKYIGNGAHLGICTASAPEGPFTFLSSSLIDGDIMGDMSMYKDDDGQAYMTYVWNKAKQIGIYQMSADYLTLKTRMSLLDAPSREAPHIFKRNGTYYLGVSETNGIDPSPTRYLTATSLAGPWSAQTMLVTPGSSTTYETQCDFVYPFTGSQGTVYMLDADRWQPNGGFQGNYLWLPYDFSATGAPTAIYYQDWDLNLGAGTWRTFDRATRDLALGKTATASSTNGANAATNVTKATTYQNYTASRWESAASDPQWIMVDLGSAMEINRVVLKWYSNYGKAFKIQVSTDSTTWTDVFSTTVGASYSVTDETFAKATARYARMNGTQRGNANGYSLFAFMVLNDP